MTGIAAEHPATTPTNSSLLTMHAALLSGAIL
jgi:hypothetical protein